MDPQMSNLLKWSIENSSPSTNSTTETPAPTRSVNADALAALFGGPSDADLMKESIAAILSTTITLPNKLVAFDNFEQLIEQIDNANNLEPLGLWAPLLGLLQNEEGELRRMAAWCVGTAVQNNERAQERALVMGAIPVLVKMAVEETDENVRRKALYALSSEMRNYQPGTDATLKALPVGLGWKKGIDAGDMEAVNELIEMLRKRT